MTTTTKRGVGRPKMDEADILTLLLCVLLLCENFLLFHVLSDPFCG